MSHSVLLSSFCLDCQFEKPKAIESLGLHGVVFVVLAGAPDLIFTLKTHLELVSFNRNSSPVFNRLANKIHISLTGIYSCLNQIKPTQNLSRNLSSSGSIILEIIKIIHQKKTSWGLYGEEIYRY